MARHDCMKPLIGTNDQPQETLVLLQLLALGRADIDNGRTVPVAGVVERIRTARCTAAVSPVTS